MRKHWIDYLRGAAIAVLIPYHAAMAWNTWSEPNYLFFGAHRGIAGIVVFFSPFLMPLLFVLAGISTKYALRKRTAAEYLRERVKKLLIPFLFGTLTVMPVMTFLAARFHQADTGSLWQHYRIFFTKFTDLTGADGGFSVGHFWFLLFLFVISVLFLLIRHIPQPFRKKTEPRAPSMLVTVLCGIPLLPLHELLNIGGKSLPEYLYLFLLGYGLLSNDGIIAQLSRRKWLLLSLGVSVSLLNTGLFLLADQSIPAVPVINTVTRSLAEWLMILALFGMANAFRNRTTPVTEYAAKRSFLFYFLHYLWIVLFQYWFRESSSLLLLFLLPVAAAYAATLLSCELCIRIPVLRFLMGTKPLRPHNNGGSS